MNEAVTWSVWRGDKIAKESQKLAEEWILADLENERCWKPYSHQHGGACCHRSQILSCEQFAKMLAYQPQSLQDGMVNRINYPTHRISVAKIPPKKIQSGGTKLAQFLQHNSPQVPVAIAPGVENCCCDSAKFKDLSAALATQESLGSKKGENLCWMATEFSKDRVTCSLQNPQIQVFQPCSLIKKKDEYELVAA